MLLSAYLVYVVDSQIIYMALYPVRMGDGYAAPARVSVRGEWLFLVIKRFRSSSAPRRSRGAIATFSRAEVHLADVGRHGKRRGRSLAAPRRP